MISAAKAVIWVNDETREIIVKPHAWGCPEKHASIGFKEGWYDPIGAAYAEWGEASDADRVHLMLETAIELGMQGFSIKVVLTAFAEVAEFRALGGKSYQMCRALTSALVGRPLECTRMSFEELLVSYAR